MTDKEAINLHLTNYYKGTEDKTFFSGFCGALKDARKMTGRNKLSGEKDGSNECGHLGSWLGTIGYLSLLDQIGGCFIHVDGPVVEPSKSSIIKALKHFSDFSDAEINVIYALRNSFAHDYSLQNIGRNGLTHHFLVDNSSTGEVIILPEEAWDGVLSNKSNRNRTYINLQLLGDRIEALVQSLIHLNSISKVKIILEGGREELIKRYSFISNERVL